MPKDFVMNSNSRALAGVAALAVGISSVLQLWERDWLRGSTGLAIAATLCVIATGLPDRSRVGKWLAYGLLVVAFVLLGIRLFGR
jgi:hypothetical protein